ncbi:hypothetical protein ABIB73_004176 [Bradyrhizobium sp. F1.4.3]|uniref:antibiotic biosynthesis monooxygenase family protein n=1 Tax=Bradyrhizobium sp. F1.4.3 TaxID=3156356 RepID=UPI003396794B
MSPASPWPRNLASSKNLENNPMHSSRRLVGIVLFRFYETRLTRRAKQGHDVIMAGCDRQAAMSHRTNPVMFVLIARIPPEGVEDFRACEDAVLPLLPEFNGCLERRLRNPDGTIEMHIVSFASDADFQNYRNDPRRAEQARLLEKSSAKLELLPMANV